MLRHETPPPGYGRLRKTIEIAHSHMSLVVDHL